MSLFKKFWQNIDKSRIFDHDLIFFIDRPNSFTTNNYFIIIFVAYTFKNMWNRIASIILRNRFIILGIITLLTVLFGYFSMTGLKIDNKYGNMLPKETETQQTYLKFKERFGITFRYCIL